MKKSIKLKRAIIVSFLLFNCLSFGQKNDNYSSKIDSLIKTTNVRQFNGVILITQNGVTKYAKAYGYSNFEKKQF
ncbi:hypothetical protein [Flavobacterium soyangense]|uniref:hypothetical protein n=1 Tax=Flavobacterium soyangense TaxID=2023265 RepID=UPI001E3D10AE|nr:hypothetical protein [Flavobacterium soyangense]